MLPLATSPSLVTLGTLPKPKLLLASEGRRADNVHLLVWCARFVACGVLPCPMFRFLPLSLVVAVPPLSASLASARSRVYRCAHFERCARSHCEVASNKRRQTRLYRVPASVSTPGSE